MDKISSHTADQRSFRLF